MKAIFILITTLFIGIFCTHDSISEENYRNDCKAELSVEKNRNFKSAFKGNLTFPIILINTSSKTTTYSLSTKKLKVACGNISNKRFSKNNTAFNVSLQINESYNANKNSSKNEITLNGGQTYKFNVTINIPEGTPYNHYSCVEVIANSKDCEDSDSVKTVLSVYVPNPSDG